MIKTKQSSINKILAFALAGIFSVSTYADGHGDHEDMKKDVMKKEKMMKEHAMEKKADAMKSAGPKIGMPAPEFSLMSADGKKVSLADYSGKLVVLEWTNHECPFVQKHYDSNNMQDLQKKYTGKDVVWLSIISSAPGNQGHIDAAQAMKLSKDRGVAATHVLFDPTGEVGKTYRAKTTPHMYIVDKSGDLVYMGGIDSIKSANPSDIPKADNYVAMALDQVMAGQKVAQPSTRPYGCGVKYKS